MAVQTAQRPQGTYLERPSPSGLADVVDIILDKGLVIDAYVRVSLVGIELLTVDARIVIASIDTYLRFAEATNRLDLQQGEDTGLAGLGAGDHDSSNRDSSNRDSSNRDSSNRNSSNRNSSDGDTGGRDGARRSGSTAKKAPGQRRRSQQ